MTTTVHHPLLLSDLCACGHDSREHHENYGRCFRPICGCTRFRAPAAGVVVVPLDFTGLTPDVVDRLLGALPESTQTTYTYPGRDKYSVVATTRHDLDGGIQVHVRAVASIDEIEDADWWTVDGFTPAEQDNYRAWRAEA